MAASIAASPKSGIFHCDAKLLALAMYISFFVCRFHLRWVANVNPISSGKKVALGPQRNIFALGMYISCCLCQFHLRRAPNKNSFFSGIWAKLVSNICDRWDFKRQLILKIFIFISPTWFFTNCTIPTVHVFIIIMVIIMVSPYHASSYTSVRFPSIP